MGAALDHSAEAEGQMQDFLAAKPAPSPGSHPLH